MLESSSTINNTIVTKQMIFDLPTIVQKWLLNSGAIGKETVHNVYLAQDLQMLMKPEQKEWSNAKAKQYFTSEPPAFNWSVKLKMNSLVDLVGRDKFENGQGEMTIKMFSLFSIVNAKNDKKINQATLQRYLAEIVWFHSASLSSYITWDAIDDIPQRQQWTLMKQKVLAYSTLTKMETLKSSLQCVTKMQMIPNLLNGL